MKLGKREKKSLRRIIQRNIKRFLNGGGINEGLQAREARYASYDYCYNYFYDFKRRKRISDLASPENLELSCLHLYSYLASWGMLRGSSPTLQKSAKFLEPVIKLISKCDERAWRIDVDNYQEDSNISYLLQLYGSICKTIKHLKHPHILASKIMLGVFGSVPAFDSNFKKSFGVAGLNKNALEKVRKFYEAFRSELDSYHVRTYEFSTGRRTGPPYTKAKLIDMIGFIQGLKYKRRLKPLLSRL